MRKFISQLIWFSLPIIIFFITGIFLPATPRASKSLLAASLQKDSLLKNVKSPRIIFVGGSNLSFGFNSHLVKESLNMNPINTGIHASVGLRYMLENTIQFVNEGDIVVLILEYDHFYRDYNYVSEELLRTIFDVNPSKIKLLNFNQLFKILPFIPRYTLSKFKSTEYFNVIESDIYGVNSFNEYGDVYTHWGLERRGFYPLGTLSGEFNRTAIEKIKEFKAQVEKRNAVLFISYPGFQDKSYLNSIVQIQKVADEYERNGFIILGNPERYMIPDYMMFNTPYHLNKEGVDYRTRLFIDDFKNYESQ